MGYKLDRPCDAGDCGDVCSRFPGAGPVNSGQQNVYSCDTSFIRNNFPCTANNGSIPCTSEEVAPWVSKYLPPDPDSGPYYKKPVIIRTDYTYPTVLTVTDTVNQAEHWLIRLNGAFVGESGGETGYTNVDYVGFNGDAAVKDGRYSKGFFLIPPGMYQGFLQLDDTC